MARSAEKWSEGAVAGSGSGALNSKMAKAATAKMKHHVKIAVKNDGEGVSCGTGRAVV